jgi:hypothetical protein
MKVKLLKDLRQDFKWKWKNNKWHTVIENEYHIYHYNSDVILTMLRINAYKYVSFFDWPWGRLYKVYLGKIEFRKFKNNSR